ncbi:MAG: 50S ribosomal protein L17 [Bacteroidetes bacterium]|nr:50S ribosomal protein L17 [Bacteroidota bacterium]MCL1969485.1 50S ribosomal protein L17 [Bacteroidota bacterium]
MRHAKKNNHLGRTSSHREAMLSNMAASLLLHKRISTTLAKAKELRKYIEPLITRGKEDTTHSRRIVFSYLQNKFAVSELFREISQKVGERPGGYTRILKTGFRKGDNAEMCIIELVDYNETYTVDEKKKTTKTRRGRGKGKTETEKTESGKQNAENRTEEVKPEVPVSEDVPEAVTNEVVEEVVAEEANEANEEVVAEEPPVEEVKE